MEYLRRKVDRVVSLQVDCGMTERTTHSEGGLGLVLRTHRWGVGVVVVVAAACAIVPAVASAEAVPPRGYDNGAEATTTKIPIIAWGKITLQSSVLGKINCTNTFYAEGWNQHEKFESKLPIRGYGEVVGWGNSSCEAPKRSPRLKSRTRRKLKNTRSKRP